MTHQALQNHINAQIRESMGGEDVLPLNMANGSPLMKHGSATQSASGQTASNMDERLPRSSHSATESSVQSREHHLQQQPPTSNQNAMIGQIDDIIAQAQARIRQSSLPPFLDPTSPERDLPRNPLQYANSLRDAHEWITTLRHASSRCHRYISSQLVASQNDEITVLVLIVRVFVALRANNLLQHFAPFAAFLPASWHEGEESAITVVLRCLVDIVTRDTIRNDVNLRHHPSAPQLGSPNQQTSQPPLIPQAQRPQQPPRPYHVRPATNDARNRNRVFKFKIKAKMDYPPVTRPKPRPPGSTTRPSAPPQFGHVPPRAPQGAGHQVFARRALSERVGSHRPRSAPRSGAERGTAPSEAAKEPGKPSSVFAVDLAAAMSGVQMRMENRAIQFPKRVEILSGVEREKAAWDKIMRTAEQDGIPMTSDTSDGGRTAAPK